MRTWILAGGCILAAVLGLAGTGYLALDWMIERSYSERHAPGTYYFATFDGPWQPFRPRREIPANEALSQNTYCIGTFDAEGRLIRLERYLDGSLFFRFEYSYHPTGKLREIRDWQRGGPARIQQFDDRSI